MRMLTGKDISLQELIDFADRYTHLGWAVEEQFDDMVSGDFDGLNPNAVDVMKKELAGFHEDIDALFDEYDKWSKLEKSEGSDDDDEDDEEDEE